MKPKCCMCGKEIHSNEHYFIIRQRSLCRDCGLKFRGKKGEINSDRTDSDNSNLSDL